MSQHGDVATGPDWELRCGRWQDVLGDVTCDALVTDPPFSERTHAGQRTGTVTDRSQITYAGWTEADALALAAGWSGRVRWWALVFSDHVLHLAHESAWEGEGWYTFAPVGWLRTNATPRVSGDGPTCAFDYITVARPRHRMPSERMGSRPGVYAVMIGPSTVSHVGGKSVEGMRAIIRDYTRPGDLVCDPCAGGGTTLLAAVMEGRRAVGAEMDPITFDKAVARLRKGYTAPLPGMEPQRMEQVGLDLGGEP